MPPISETLTASFTAPGIIVIDEPSSEPSEKENNELSEFNENLKRAIEHNPKEDKGDNENG